MKRYLRTVLALVAVVFIVVAGCTESKPPPPVDTAADPALIMDMPIDPETEGSAPAPAAAEAAPAEEPAAKE